MKTPEVLAALGVISRTVALIPPQANENVGTFRVGAVDWFLRLADLRACAVAIRLIEQAQHERKVWCDKPEDRLYHASDRTWWKRAEDGRCVRADPPDLTSQHGGTCGKSAQPEREATGAVDDGVASIAQAAVAGESTLDDLISEACCLYDCGVCGTRTLEEQAERERAVASIRGALSSTLKQAARDRAIAEAAREWEFADTVAKGVEARDRLWTLVRGETP